MRTGRFLLQYIGDAELRSGIRPPPTETESFGSFVRWLYAFGGGGAKFAENDRGRQRKIIQVRLTCSPAPRVACTVYLLIRALLELPLEIVAIGATTQL